MTQTNTQERWQIVSEWPDYEVSSLGKVARWGRPVKPMLSGSGYQFVTLCGPNGKKPKQVHTLVALAFCGFGREVNHIDGNKSNNAAENLEWVTRSENQRHAADVGLKPSGEKSHLCTKLTADKVREIRALCAQGVSQEKVARQFNISQTHVGKINRRIKWRQIN